MIDRPNILLIVMDCARFDYLSAYGYSQPTTPHLERLASDGVLFKNAFAAAPWTPPSHASLFTGTYPSKHGVDVNENLYLSAENRTLAEMLAENGYRTFGFLPDVHLSSVRGFEKGFQDFTELWRIPRFHLEYDWLTCLARNFLFGRDKRTYYTNRVLQRWLKDNYSHTDPFFIFVNYKTLHNTYSPPPEFRRRFEHRNPGIDMDKVRYYSRRGGYSYMARQLELTEDELLLAQSWYAGALAYLDFRLGELFAYLKELGAYDNTLIIVTADHGENFGEHHLAYHLFCLYDTLLHVPLIVSCPSLLPRGQEVAGLVSLVDVVPTVVDLLGLEKERGSFHGHSLLPMNRQTDSHEYIVAEFGRPQAMLERLATRFPGHDFSAFDRGLRCIRTPEYKFIAGSDNSEELYALQDDPGEAHNCVNELGDVAADLRAKLGAWRTSIGVTYQGQQSKEDAALVKALEQLGYF